MSIVKYVGLRHCGADAIGKWNKRAVNDYDFALQLDFNVVSKAHFVVDAFNVAGNYSDKGVLMNFPEVYMFTAPDYDD